MRGGRTARDRRLLYACAFLRALSTGLTGVLLGIYLAKLGFDPAHIGYAVAAGLAGLAATTMLVTWGADRFGRRRVLLAVAALGAAGGLGVAIASGFNAILAAAFLGMLNGMGRDRGPALVLEQAILPATTTDAGRTGSFAWYNVLQDAGHAAGSLLAGAPYAIRALLAVGEIPSFRLAVGLAACTVAATVPLYAMLSAAVESPARRTRLTVSRGSRKVLRTVSSLFAVDALAGGFLLPSLIAYFFYRRFGAGEGPAAVLFFAARVLNALSHLGAAWLAKRIGLVNTMVFTHIPSSLLLATVAIAPSFPVAAALFLLREGLVEMDVPTRQSFVMAAVRPEERTVASGVTHLVRVGGWAVAPSFAGALMQGVALGVPLLVGAGMKIVYDVALYAAFRNLRPPEEAGDLRSADPRPREPAAQRVTGRRATPGAPGPSRRSGAPGAR